MYGAYEAYAGTLDADQAAAAAAPGPVLVLAGAGSGKTRACVGRLLRLAAEGTWPAVAITFTTKAAQEIAHRVETEGGPTPIVGTFHSVAARYLRAPAAAKAAGVQPGWRVYDEDDALELANKVGEAYSMDGAYILKARAAQAPGAAFAQQALTTAVWQGTIMDGETEAVAAYGAALAAANALDFTGLLLAWRDALGAGACPLPPAVVVDEYQDTDELQEECLRLLCAQGADLCAVGDDAQAIYGWRGASRANMHGFTSRWPGAKVIRLGRNYRSTPQVCQAAAGVRAAMAGALRLGTIPCRQAGANCVGYVAPDEEAEAAAIVRKVKALLAKPGWGLNCIAVLTRARWVLAPLEQALAAEGLPVRLGGGRAGWAKAAEVVDGLAYARLLLDANDVEALARASQAPARGVGPVALAALKAGLPLQAKAQAAISALKRDAGAAAGKIGQAGAAVALQTLLALQGYDATYMGRDGKLAKRQANLEALLLRLDGLSHAQLPTALAKLCAATGQHRGPAITLATVHYSKGLEWRAVFVVGLEDGVWPDRRSDEDEEQRLAYVAFTRARDILYAGWCQTRGGRMMRPASYLQQAGLLKLPQHNNEVRLYGP